MGNGDLSRERLQQLREMCRHRRESLSWQDIGALLSMAERAVSVSTFQTVCEALNGYPPGMGSALQRPSSRDVGIATLRDLRAAATSLKETTDG